MRVVHAFVSLLVVVLLFVGCSPQSSFVIDSPNDSSSSSMQRSPLDRPSAAHDSPLPTPMPTLPPAPPLVVPTPSAGQGVIWGTLTIESTELPMAGVEVFLGEHIGATGDTPLFGLDAEAAPRTVADKYGRFVFADVPPGHYVIIIWNPLNSIMARDPATGKPLQILLEAGQTVDVGVLTEPRP